MKNLAVVIPAHNEEKPLPKTLELLCSLVSPSDVYLVSDASTDKTLEIASKFRVNLFESRKRVGKPRILKLALKQFELLNRYKFILFLDADTRPDKGFFHHALAAFKKREDIVCVCAQVLTERRFNIFVAYRALMYFVWQDIYKTICSWFNMVTIAPGTSSVYRTKALRKIKFDPRLILEDFDLTFQIHRRKLGRIVYVSRAKIFTQDPDNFRDYFKQLTRWQLGFFQTAIKHRVPFGGQRLDWVLLYFVSQEVLYFLLLISVFLLAIWLKFFALYPRLLGFYIEPQVIFALLIFDVWLVVGFGIVASFSTKQFFILPFLPFLWLVQFVNFAATIKAFYLAVFRSISGAWVSPKRRSGN